MKIYLERKRAEPTNWVVLLVNSGRHYNCVVVSATFRHFAPRDNILGRFFKTIAPKCCW